tara:strand:- start:592 stop:906 length:315 start_codon:yes stop_codon:yes gene_type:complete
MKNQGILIVRAEVDHTDRVAFDEWYEDEHLLDALTEFGADRAWRGWSEVEDGIHYANYAFSNVEAAIAILSSSALKNLVKKFDEVWGDRVSRTRNVIEVTQYIG